MVKRSRTEGTIEKVLAKREPEPAERVVIKSPSYASLYTNDVQVMTSPWDLRLVLGEIGDQPTGQSINVTQLAELRMSPQFAKRLTLILLQQLRAYEELFGNIPGPKD